jgi:hypothetical protein
MRVLWTTVSALILSVPLASAQSPALEDVLARFDAYLAEYEPKLSELIADEVMDQVIRRGARAAGADGVEFGADRGHRMESEVAFVGLPDNAGWLGFRHVKKVNNRDVKNSEASLAAALGSPGYSAARRLLMEGARHNRGLARTTNLPNLPLEFLHQRNRRRLLAGLDGTERVRGIEVVRVVFDERAKPTLIGNPNGNDMPSVIRAWVDPKTGALLRAEVRTFESGETRELSSSIRVEFDRDPKLELLVPVKMEESFPVPPPNSGLSVATYKNFRRFQTSARIVPPPGAR